MGIDERINVVAYDKQWALLFEKEKEQLLRIFGDAAAGIEHFGSTSVPGMAAKPIVDLLVGVAMLELDPCLVRQLERRGYEGFGEAGVPGRLYFRKRGEHAFNLAIVEWQGEQWINNLLIRDYLRTNPAAAEQYSEHKRKAIERGANTLLAYSEQKADFVQDLLEQARRSLNATKLENGKPAT